MSALLETVAPVAHQSPPVDVRPLAQAIVSRLWGLPAAPQRAPVAQQPAGAPAPVPQQQAQGVPEAPVPAADAPVPGKDGDEEEAPGGKKRKRSKKKKDKAAAAADAVVDAWAPSAVAAAATLYSAAVRELSRERGCTLYQINALLGAKHAHAHALLFSLSVRNCVAAMAEGRALQASQQQGAEGQQLGQPPRLPACLPAAACRG